MTPTQTTILIVGLSLTFTVYLLFKWWQRRSRIRAAQSDPFAPKKRTSSGQRQTAAVAVPEQKPVSEESPTEVLPVFQPELAAAATPTERRYANVSVMNSLWSSEPRDEETRAETLADEYPYDEGDYTFGGLTPIFAALSPASDQAKVEMTKSLRNAGYYSPHAWQNFLAVRYLGLILPLLLFGVLLILVPAALEPMMMAGLIVGPILGWSLPAIYVRSRAAERLREMENGMPDMLDLLNMCVSQGMTVPQALGRVSREMAPVYPALSTELGIVTEQARVGSLTQGLTNFSSRVDVPDVHSFTSLLTQTEQMGTSVSEALSEYSDGMRETLKQRADEKANSATFKILFPTVLCLMPAVFLFLMGPALVELDRFFTSGGVDALNDQQAIEQILNE